MGRLTSLLLPFKFKRRRTPRSPILQISLPELDPRFLPCFLRDTSNIPPTTIHGYTVPGRFLAPCNALFLDTLTIGDFKRLGQLVISATGVGRLSHLSLLPHSDHLIMVAVTKTRDIPRDDESCYSMENELRLRLLYFLVTRYGGYFRCLAQMYPGELESLVGHSHRCHPLAVV
ncbi:hypothetical protein H072_3548 [Dactylellina haptotyla CBS 200.50]|uniref:Uncharacterized protein n=1 Tax=Dactylellina haptotyla (strain CBS 200.50) TaxID=1284197 RepID=S8C3Z7_DACHA|nr:hypothetical protein H072_3548 [Dactylellina haptotyla CBS 200.50]